MPVKQSDRKLLTVTALSLCSSIPCTHKTFHKLLQYWLWKDFNFGKLWNFQNNKQARKQTNLGPFSHSSALNKKANNLIFSGSQKSDICHLSWRFCVQIRVITYITRRTLTKRTELKAYWHFRHFANDHEIKKQKEKSHIINL